MSFHFGTQWTTSPRYAKCLGQCEQEGYFFKMRVKSHTISELSVEEWSRATRFWKTWIQVRKTIEWENHSWSDVINEAPEIKIICYLIFLIPVRGPAISSISIGSLTCDSTHHSLLSTPKLQRPYTANSGHQSTIRNSRLPARHVP